MKRRSFLKNTSLISAAGLFTPMAVRPADTLYYKIAGDPVAANSTIHQVSWKKSRDLSVLAGKNVRIRFILSNGHLYSFWVSPDKNGASHGYLASGGPGYSGGIDNIGIKAYKNQVHLEA